MRKKGLVILCSLLIFLLMGCGESSISLVGQWISEDENEDTGDPFELFSDSTAIEFFSDGTAIISYNSGRTNSVKWVMENERLKLTLETGIFGNIATSYSCQLTKNNLMLTDDEGKETAFTKVE